MSDLAQQLSIIAAHAPELRKAGVAMVKVGDVEVTLHADEPVMMAAQQPQDEKPKSALDDPTSYGWPEGTAPPGFKPPPERTDR